MTGPTSGEHPSQSRRLRQWIAGFLALVCVLALIVIAVELAVLRPRFNEFEAEQADRADVVRVAQQFMVRFNTYQAGDLGTYQESVNEILSTKARASFKKVLENITELVQTSGLRSTGEVLTSGVASVDPDSASVLVVADAAVKSKLDTRARHFRWEISLVKVDGTWLVDDFEPIT